ACALFADFSNQGRQDVIVVRANGPLLFVNEGGGKFRQNPDAFRFANPPQGTFTGAAAADYDRDGWLDVYFCLYSYYQGTGQYKYPSPYHDAENGPPNFLMRNQHDGTFRDVTAASGLSENNQRYSFCCGWSDYNHDGWPDLYVVNDFGRKNLYRNKGDGTFTDIAAQADAEDIGAGMSVSWLDYDQDGIEDLYVGNMWTATGERISTQQIFKKESPQEIRALYRKHAMGNSLLRNRGNVFDDVTNSAGVGIGRWAWSSDAFDFDHDGFPDLYIVNGMVSGPSRRDLNSFFWRQVVANSPDQAGASQAYEQGWNAINELIRSDGTWSGYERNVFYANNRDGTFSDVSGVVGMGFAEDGRSFALADFDHDGRLEVFIKNRNAPQLRILKNGTGDLPPSIAFRLQGTKSNRDAIGAAITIESSAGRQTRRLQAGSGFLSQHSKDIFFGLGAATGSVSASIRWPSGLVHELRNLPINHRIWVEEGMEPSRLELFKTSAPPKSEAPRESEQLPTNVETWLLAPVLAPDFSLPDLSGSVRTLSAMRGKPALLHVWTTKSPGSRQELNALQKSHAAWTAKGLQLIAVNVDDPADNPVSAAAKGLSFLVLRGSQDVAAIYNILYRQLFDRHRDLTLPTSFLINGDGEIVKIYQGTIVPNHVAHDFQNIPRTDAERLARGLPFPSAFHSLEFRRNYLSLGAIYFQRGYLDQAQDSFQQALRDDPASAEALYGVGSVYLNQNKNAEAKEAFERAVKLPANYPGTLPDGWNNLGVIATREGRFDDAIQYFQHALQLDPRHLLSLDNLGNAYRVEKRWQDARKVLEIALKVAPQDPEANYSLGMVFAQTDDPAKAYEYLQRALKARPIYPEALNNLGVLYLVTQRRDQAVESFEQCIRVAPGFDQAYLNLARVYALEGARDKARALLLDLLKQHPGHPQAKQMLGQL
ncbi:MAG TPA: tetratricopeptide repeat protein, partial [Candidatus Sulfotelmatobacter sp.]|nr:tetratricopeptide repeat protein [Candidatus Sulfotelmatobacter sp.]